MEDTIENSNNNIKKVQKAYKFGIVTTGVRKEDEETNVAS